MRLYLSVLLAAIACSLFSCSDKGVAGDDAVEPEEHVDTMKCNIAVIAPLSQGYPKEVCQDMIKKAEDAINKYKVYYGFVVKVKVVDWVDESTEDVTDYMEGNYDNSMIDAFIGPFYASNVEKAAAILNRGWGRKPLIAPTCSSEDILRRYAGDDGFLWSLVESDVTQMEIISEVLHTLKYSKISIISKNNAYGKTFNDWFGYCMNEEPDLIPWQIETYNDETDLAANFKEILEEDPEYGDEDAIVVAAQTAKEIEIILKMAKGQLRGRKLFFTNSFFNNQTIKELGELADGCEGISTCTSSNALFSEQFKALYGYRATWEPFFLDAVQMAISSKMMALVLDGDDTTDDCSKHNHDLNHMLRLLTNSDLPDVLKTVRETNGMETTFLINLVFVSTTKDVSELVKSYGVTGAWEYSKETYTTPLRSSYCHYVVSGNQIVPLCFFNRDKDNQTSWSWVTEMDVSYEENIDLIPDVPNDHWALIVGCGTGWPSYRFQSDALAFYHWLKEKGYDDDHIVLIEEGDIAENPNNPKKGVVVNTSDLYAKNLWNAVQIDYRISDITPEKIGAILLGESRPDLPHVINSTRKDNIIMFWAGHSHYEKGMETKSGTYLSQDEFKNIVQKVDSAGRYLAFLCFLETCYAGDMVADCQFARKMLFITSCQEGETSHPSQSLDGQTWVSNSFTQNLFRALKDGQLYDRAAEDFIKDIRNKTPGQHVSAYNTKNFYNLKRCSPSSFINKVTSGSYEFTEEEENE